MWKGIPGRKSRMEVWKCEQMPPDSLCAFEGVRGAESVVRSEAVNLAKSFRFHPRVRESC